MEMALRAPNSSVDMKIAHREKLFFVILLNFKLTRKCNKQMGIKRDKKAPYTIF